MEMGHPWSILDCVFQDLLIEFKVLVGGCASQMLLL